MTDERQSTTSPLRVFVSYGHDEHQNLADRLRSDLHERGHEVWFDKAELHGGDDWEHAIEAGLEWLASDRSRARMILLLTPHAVRRPDGYCLNEVARAVSRRIGIIPVMVVHCEPPLSICRIQHLDMRSCVPLADNETAYRQSLDTLLTAIEGPGPDVQGFGMRKQQALEPIDFAAEFTAHPPEFVGREWLFTELEDWIHRPDSPRVFVLVGAPGMGKTALAVELIHRSHHVAAFHICVHSSQQKSDATRLVTSIAYQLSTQLPLYDETLKTLDLEYVTSRYDASTLFDVLLTQPLSRMPAPGSNLAIVVDGLDEVTKGDHNSIATFLSERAGHLPDWVRVLVTTRPEPEVLGPLESLGLHRIESRQSENMADIRAYLTARLGILPASPAAVEHAVDTIAERCEGAMLYARAACDQLSRDGITTDTLQSLPDGLFALYTRQFSTRCPDASQYGTTARPLLSLLLAGHEPLRFDLICAALGRTPTDVWDTVLSLGSLVADNGDTLTLQHKSLRDWLSDRRSSRSYHVSVDDGHAMLAAAASNWRTMPRKARAYLFEHGPQHLLYCRQWDALLASLSDLSFEKGRTVLLDSAFRDPDRLDLLLDLVDEMTAAGTYDLNDALLDGLHSAIEMGHWHATEPLAEVADTGFSPEQRQRMTFLRAWSLQQCGQLADALKMYERMSPDAPDPVGFVAFRRADAIREAGDFDAAFVTYAELANRAHVPERLATLYVQQYADLLFVRGQYVDALEVLNPAIERGPGAARDAFSEALRIRGHIHRVLMNSDQALIDYQAAHASFTALGHRSGMARVETNLAEVYATSDPDRALWHADQAIAANREIGMPLEAGKAVRAKGLALAILGRYAESDIALAEAASILTDVGYAAGVCETLANRVVLDVRRDHYSHGRSLTLELAHRLHQLNAYPLLIVRSCLALAYRSEPDDQLTALHDESAHAVQWAVDPVTYRDRLLGRLGLL